MLGFFILLPLAGLILTNLPFNGAIKKLAWLFTLLLTMAQVLVAAVAQPDVLNGNWPTGDFLGLALYADNLSRVMLVSIGLVAFVTLLLGSDMVQDRLRRINFVSVLLIAMIGMNGMVLLRDLFTLYVFLEITSVASFVLIAFDRTKHGLEGAFKYLILSAVATTLMLTGVAVMLMLTGSTKFYALPMAIQGGSVIGKIAIGSFVCGLLIKGGLVPFHGWLPDAYSSAPAAVSVLLAGIATKAGGIYALIRLFNYFPTSPAVMNMLLLVGAISVVVGAVAALGQNDMKRMFAYSSISQVGYIVLGLATGSPIGIAGAIFHLFNHSIFKSLLFVNAAAVQQQLGTTEMNRLGGLGSKMPVTNATGILAVLSTAGVPPLAGFWSKLLIIIALWQGGHTVYAFIAVLVSVLTLGYLLVMQRRVFFGKSVEGVAQAREGSMGLVVASVVLAAVTVVAGVLPFFPWVLKSLGVDVDSLGIGVIQ